MSRKQELFDKMLNHLRQQGEPSRRLEKGCRYRLQQGDRVLSCAVGCLISDEEYSPDIEGATIDSGNVVAAVEASGYHHLSVFERDFLRSCQIHMHDSPSRKLKDSHWGFPALVEFGAINVAEEYGLTYTPPPVEVVA